MVFSVVSIIEEKPVVDFSIAADASRNRLVRVRAVMTVITVQVAEAMAEIPERQKIQNKPPVDEMNRFRWDNDSHYRDSCCEWRYLGIAPVKEAVVRFA